MPKREELFVTLELGHAPRGRKPPVNVGTRGTPQQCGFGGEDRGCAGAGTQPAVYVGVQLPGCLDGGAVRPELRGHVHVKAAARASVDPPRDNSKATGLAATPTSSLAMLEHVSIGPTDKHRR